MIRSWASLLGWVAAFGAATGAAAPAQNFRQITPDRLQPGPVVIHSEVYYVAADGSWVVFHVLSDLGWYIVRMTRVSSGGPRLSESEHLEARPPPKSVSSRDISWNELKNPKIRVYGPATLWLEGAIRAVLPGERMLEADMDFKDGLTRVRLVLEEDVVYARNPSPTQSNVAYGPDPLQTMDVYLSHGRRPCPVMVFIHGGGWVHLNKDDVRNHPCYELLDAGISVVSINYRFLPPGNIDALTPAVAVPMGDALRAVQFVRDHAREWGLDPDRLGLCGESAGACTALWLAKHYRSDLPIRCVAALGPQTTLDPAQMIAWLGPGVTYGPNAFGIHAAGGDQASFAQFLSLREKLLPLIDEYSPAAGLKAAGPPVFIDYGWLGLAPMIPAEFTHSPRLGIGYQRLAQEIGRECYLCYDGKKDERYGGWLAFMRNKLLQ